MKTVIMRPAEINQEHLKQIIDLIVAGGQIRRAGLKEKIQRAALVACKINDDRIICTATLKNPFKSYMTKVFMKAKVKTKLSYEKELGYIATHINYEGKGHCKNLLTDFFKIISQNSIYATTRKPAMIHILNKFGFEKTGSIYEKDLHLLVYNGT